MSVLLVDLFGERGRALVERLVSAGDEVRVVEDDLDAAELWRHLGARVAIGSSRDSDLIERAAQQARTVVVVERPGRALTGVLAATLEGLAAAALDARLVVCADRITSEVASLVRGSGLAYVILRAGSSRRAPWRARRVPSPGALAEAIDAADDLDGRPALELDLTSPEDRRRLGL